MKKIKFGIVGFGLVGRSAFGFLSKHEKYSLLIWDEKKLKSCDLDRFIDSCDKILVSPGIDIRRYKRYFHKTVSELDLFFSYFLKKTIAVTGTLGKTTVTQLISNFLPFKSTCIGNIGRPMLDVIDHQEKINCAVLELSSFQLEQSRMFVPDIAVFTNFYPNHIDRHETIENYFDAKWNLFLRQKEGQRAIFSFDLLVGDYKKLFLKKLSKYKGDCYFVSKDFSQNIPNNLLNNLNTKIFFARDNNFYLGEKVICSLDIFKEISFKENILFALGAAYLSGANLKNIMNIEQAGLDSKLSKNRLEKFFSYNGIDFYNDSKATVMEATIAAVKRLSENKRPIILILGGLSKGADRRRLVSFLSNASSTSNIKNIFCLGSSDEAFASYQQYPSLSDLGNAIIQLASRGDQVLFSPSGSSFDLFKNYEERGELFKQTILELYGQ